MLTVKSTINIAGQTVPQIIPVVQGDTGRSILFTLADFTIPQGSTATYYVQKPSGEAVYNTATIDGNTVLVELTAQSIIENGDNYGQVRIENDGEIVTSFDFILLVKPFRGIDATQSTTEMNIFDKAVEQAEEAIDEAKEEALEEIAEAGSGNIAEEFDAANSYLAGEYTIYNAKLYRFTSNHTGSWSGSDAEEVTVGDELTDIKDGLTAVESDVTDLKEDLIYSKGVAKETKNGLTLYEPDNLLDITRVTNGYITKNGNISQSTSYFYTDYIPVNEGDVIGFYNFSGAGMIGRGTISARFLAAYDANKAIISSAGSDTTVSSYTVPNGVAYIIPSLAMSYKPLNPFISKNGAPISYSAGFQSKLVPQAQAGRHYYRYKCDSSFFNEAFEIPTMSLCKNTIISFSGYVKSFTFNSFKLSIGQGSNHYGAAWIEIDKENVTWHLFTSSDASYPQAHNIPFDTVQSGQLSISIIVNDNTKATLKILFGEYEYTRTLGFYGFSDQPFFVTSSYITIEKETFSVTNKDFDAPVFTFGDSYIAIIESEAKWTHYYVADGFGDNMCINAFPGADSSELASAFANTLAIATPQKILWCVGMNDGSDTDSSIPNAQWLSSVENLLSVCKAKGIEPLFVTIPTVPSVNNEAKNKWIRESGYRFADFALAVGADSTGSWYSDMLSTDNVHPSPLGAKTMYYRLMADLPDLFV